MELLDIQITCFQPFPHSVQQDLAIAKQLEALTVKTCRDVKFERESLGKRIKCESALYLG